MIRTHQAINKLLLYRDQYFINKKTAAIAASLGRLSEKWLEPNYIWRRRAIAELVKSSRFSHSMSHALLDSIFKELTRVKLKKLLCSELGDLRALDGFFFKPVLGQRLFGIGPRLITHVFAANLPNPAVSSLVHGLLVKSAGAVKVSSWDAGILPIYLESLKKHDPGLSKVNILLPAQDRTGLREWVAASEVVVAYGNEKSIQTFWKMTGPRKKFVGYGHRVSFSLYTREALTQKGALDLARRTARDIWMGDQRGCLSPAVIYVEAGAAVTGLDFAREVAKELGDLSGEGNGLPPAKTQRILDKEELKNRWRLKKAKGEEVCFWESPKPGEWAVFFEKKNQEFSISCAGQTVFVREYQNLEDVYRALKSYQKYLQGVALEAGKAKREKISLALSRLGVNRITRAGKLQEPPFGWRHDGMSPIAGWLRWTGLE